ncbi:E3 ubiquitin-protein ligase march5 [Halocaridina rubra]|uniref:E3 ubiquitin-protein ligase march5 n=1 Tax=Halocaridina rubra TaxID=373956 RepID=A0AAN8X1Y2_HALRR
MALMEQADPLVLLVGLPTIPIFLILGKMVRWEDKVLRLIRASVQRLPFLKYLLPAFRYEETAGVSTTAVISDPVNATRVLCGALSLPTLATIVGRLFFPSAQDNLNRTLLGGASFLLVKGLFKVYYKQQQHVMQSRRKIIDYPHGNSVQVPSPSTSGGEGAEAVIPPSSPQAATNDSDREQTLNSSPSFFKEVSPPLAQLPTPGQPSSSRTIEQQYLQHQQQ